jgi:hypothetical protein
VNRDGAIAAGRVGDACQAQRSRGADTVMQIVHEGPFLAHD